MKPNGGCFGKLRTYHFKKLTNSKDCKLFLTYIRYPFSTETNIVQEHTILVLYSTRNI